MKAPITYRSYDNSMRFTVQPGETKKLWEAERLTRLTEVQLNDHVVRQHLLQPRALQLQGIRFDIELARFLGLRLEQAAEVSLLLLAGVNERCLPQLEGISDLETCVRMGQSNEVSTFDLLDELNFASNIETCLGQLSRQGVADRVEPYHSDSFYSSKATAELTESFILQFNVELVEVDG